MKKGILLRGAPILLIALSVLWSAAAVRANVVLSYFELTRGSSPTQVIVRWGTESESSTAGFLLKRAVNADPGQASAIHTEPARGSAISGADYEYIDNGLTPGQVYYYWLYELTTDGDQVFLAVAHITAGGIPPSGPPRTYLPLITISASSHGGATNAP